MALNQKILRKNQQIIAHQASVEQVKFYPQAIISIKQ